MGLLVPAGSLVVLLAAGWAFLRSTTLRDYDATHKGNPLAQLLFAAVFALSANLLQLLICEILGWMDPSTRQLNWRFDMVSMLALLLIVLPFYHSYGALAGRMPRARAAAGAALLLAGGLAAFWRLGGAVPGIPAGHGLRMMSMLEAVSRVGMLGSLQRP